MEYFEAAWELLGTSPSTHFMAKCAQNKPLLATPPRFEQAYRPTLFDAAARISFCPSRQKSLKRSAYTCQAAGRAGLSPSDTNPLTEAFLH